MTDDVPAPPEVPVVIVGAGPVGLAAAIMLARRGVRSLVLERYPGPYPLPRAVHVDDEVRRILQQLGVAESFAGVSRPASGLRLLAADHRVIAEFRRHRSVGVHGHPQSTLFDQPDLERLLRAELARHPQAELRTGVEVTSVEVTSAGEVISIDEAGPPGADLLRVRYRTAAGAAGAVQAAVVLGCDGANSVVRGFVGGRLEDLGFEERWLVLDVRCAVPLPVWDGVEQVCDPRRAATAMRIGPDRYRWEFRLHDAETVAELVVPQRLRVLLAPWTGPLGASPEARLEVLRAAEYTFRARLADRWRRGRVFLLGDAAHLTPPFIGQGLGSGLRDVQNLVWKLALVLARPDQPDQPDQRDQWRPDRSGEWDDEQLLDSYQAERRPHARALIRLAVVAGWAMTGGQDRAATVRRALLAGFCRVPGATGLVLDRPAPPLTSGPLVLRAGAGTRLRWSARARRPFRDPAGTLVPQPWVTVIEPAERTDGVDGVERTQRTQRPQRIQRTQRLDDVLGPGFTVLIDGPGPVDAGLRALAAGLNARVLRLSDRRGAPDAAADGGDEVVLRSPELRRWLAGRGAGAVLLRPDRVVLATAPRRPRSGHARRHCPGSPAR
jgi:3-(3-hydroxy-phenyl)propionate hydroxylase